jgi:hypothetical protein
MRLHSETPPLTGSIVRNGGSVFTKSLTLSEYRNPPLNAKEFAATVIAGKFNLTLPTARVVCELSGIGGRLA